jgi:hypothetical protein
VDAEELRKWLLARLPEYMVPAAIVALEQFPLSSNGKVDRKRLPAPIYLDQSKKEARGAATLTEEIIAGIWAEVLRLPRISVEDDFFALGGHSLLATQVISRIKSAFQTEVALRVLFESPTVAGLAHRVDRLVRQKRGLASSPIRPVPRNQSLPLSFAQQRLWFLDQLEPGSPLYNFSHIVRITGHLDRNALEKSLNEIVRRHESLRTSFPALNDRPVQVIAPSLEVPLRFVDVSRTDTHQGCEAEARRLATEEAQKPFHLATGPLLRALVIKIADDDHALVLMMHHIITDRWSMGVFSQELAALYEAQVKGKPATLPPLEIQYADFAVWQRQYLSDEVLQKQLDHWRKHLEGAPAVVELPTDRPRQGAEQFWGAQHKRPLAPDLLDAIGSFNRSQRGTLFMALLSGFQLLLAKLSGQQDIMVGTDLANRNHLETERLIGFFVNLLPIRARVNPEASFLDFFGQVREASLDAMAYQDIPFDKLVEELRPERSLTHNPLVQILFVMQNTTKMVNEFGGLKLGPLGVSGSSRFDLVLFITDTETEPSAMWFYNPKLFDAATIERMGISYELLLSKAFGDPAITQGAIFAALDELGKQQRENEQKKFHETGIEKLRQIRRKKSDKVHSRF